MFTVEPNDPTLAEAAEQLAKMEAADAADSPNAQTPEPGSAVPAERTGDEVQPVARPSEPNPPVTPATEEPPKPPEQKSKFAQAQNRLEGGFKKLSEDKTALEKERESFKAERERLVSERKAFEDQRQAASQPKYKPEDYDNLAIQREAEAQKAEAEGEFDQAVIKRYEAKNAREYAAELRKNPPKAPQTNEEAQAAHTKATKEWMSKALIDFPKLGNKDSDEAKAYALLIKTEPKILEDPKLLYFAGRLACAEASAASVSGKDKELDGLRAKVKELETKLTIPGESVAIMQAGRKSTSEQTDEELEAELRREAEAMGPGRF